MVYMPSVLPSSSPIRVRDMMFSSKTLTLWAAFLSRVQSQFLHQNANLGPPGLGSEPISIQDVPLPPVVETAEPGACSYSINPHDTGCIGQTTGLQAGSFLPDGSQVLATVNFTGAPAAPDQRHIYDGQQLIILKVDGTTFPNGDPWKCLTCGVPRRNALDGFPSDYAYPQAFRDGKRALAGSFIVGCGDFQLDSEDCEPEELRVYPIRLENRADGTGPGAMIRELRLHPDNVHIGFNVFDFTAGKLGQMAYFARLHLNAKPRKGSSFGPRYDLVHVNQLYDPNASQPLTAVGGQLVINNSAIDIGELRGFSGTGKEVLYLGYPAESCNIDVFAADLGSGAVRRLTSHPGYVDPVQMSPDDKSIVIMDTRGNDRTNFMAGLRGIPPILDQITTTACSSVRNNGARRFFQPHLLDQFGDREAQGYYGQEINSASSGQPGSGGIDDPEWNGRADPWFSPDGTKIVYWQAKTVPPACGGENPLPCSNSTEPGGRTERILIAHLTSRSPIEPNPVEERADYVPWAVPHIPGSPSSTRAYLSEGNYTLRGLAHGSANVMLIEDESRTHLETIRVEYHNFSNDGIGFLKETQQATEKIKDFTINHLDWSSNLTFQGHGNASQVTSPGGFHLTIDVLKNIFEANGSLVTVVNGTKFTQPANAQ